MFELEKILEKQIEKGLLSFSKVMLTKKKGDCLKRYSS